MGKFRVAQTNRRSKQILYSISTEGDWFRDMVCYTRLEGKCSSPSQMENGNSYVRWSIFHKLSRRIRSHPFTRTATIAFYDYNIGNWPYLFRNASVESIAATLVIPKKFSISGLRALYGKVALILISQSHSVTDTALIQ
jgi:hypothetical protein